MVWLSAWIYRQDSSDRISNSLSHIQHCLLAALLVIKIVDYWSQFHQRYAGAKTASRFMLNYWHTSQGVQSRSWAHFLVGHDGKVGRNFVGETKQHRIMTAGTKEWLLTHLRFAPEGCWNRPLHSLFLFLCTNCYSFQMFGWYKAAHVIDVVFLVKGTCLIYFEISFRTE